MTINILNRIECSSFEYTAVNISLVIVVNYKVSVQIVSSIQI